MINNVADGGLPLGQPSVITARLSTTLTVLLSAHAAVQFRFTPAITAAADAGVTGASQPSASDDQTDGQANEGDQKSYQSDKKQFHSSACA